MKFTLPTMQNGLMRSVAAVYDYPNPCDTCEKDCTNNRGCKEWEIRFRAIWKQFNAYPLRQYRKAPKSKNFRYEHPDMIGKYLAEGPCPNCEFEAICDVPCTMYWHWWDARMAALKKKYGME